MFSNQKLLIVENNVLNQKVIGGLLRKYNINFDVAENGEVAVNLFQENKYDLILMDCEMPVMDGFIGKPFYFENLINTYSEILKKQK